MGKKKNDNYGAMRHRSDPFILKSPPAGTDDPAIILCISEFQVSKIHLLPWDTKGGREANRGPGTGTGMQSRKIIWGQAGTVPKLPDL